MEMRMQMDKDMECRRVRWTKIAVFFMVMFYPDPLPAEGLGPFYLPVVGMSEVFRETPAFVSPGEHETGRVNLTVAARWLNVWAFHSEADEPYDWEADPETFPFEHGSFFAGHGDDFPDASDIL